MDSGRINFVRLFPKQAQQNTAIGAVAHSSQCQRAIELDLNTVNGRQKPVVGKPSEKPISGAHGSDRMGTGRPNANFEQIKDTGVYGGAR